MLMLVGITCLAWIDAIARAARSKLAVRANTTVTAALPPRWRVSRAGHRGACYLGRYIAPVFLRCFPLLPKRFERQFLNMPACAHGVAGPAL